MRGNPKSAQTLQHAPAFAKHIEQWPVERLIPYARNARTHSDAQVAQVAGSIREFGFTNPILVENSPERALVEQAGLVVGMDGLQFML